MHKKLWIKFTIMLGIMVFFVLTAILGMEGLGVNRLTDIKFGIDIRGGVSATIYPEVEDFDAVTKEQLETARRILEQRLESRGTFDANITTDLENKRVILEIPYASGDDNPQKVIDSLGRMALLTFREVDPDEYVIDPVTRQIVYTPTDMILIEGSDIKSAQAVLYNNQPVVSIEFTTEGAVKFSEATRRLIGKPIAIYLDDTQISAPVVNAHITSGDAFIEGSFTPEAASELANYIQYGALPFGLVAREINSITPILGESALNVTLRAALVAFILVVLYMLFFYRLPGFVASFALVGLVASVLFWVSAFDASITLPGIAGIILTIGMGVDANVIIYERIKEELRNKTEFSDAIDIGYKSAFSAIFDANVTTLISGIILYTLGSGPIKGFALTLMIGVIMSFITAIMITKHIIKALASIQSFRNNRFFGVKEVLR
ncbi:MAG: protein translocase subunit SecD [Clostridia bacterium]